MGEDTLTTSILELERGSWRLFTAEDFSGEWPSVSQEKGLCWIITKDILLSKIE